VALAQRSAWWLAWPQKIAGAGFPTQASKPGAGIPADGVVVPPPAVYFAARFEVRAHCVIIK